MQARDMRLGFTVAEQAKGRLMRAPDHPAGGVDGGSQSTGGDNQGGNSGQAGNDSQTQDNGGLGIDPRTFWEQPSGSAGAAPSGGSAANPGGSGGQEPQQGGHAQKFAETLTNMKFPDVMTDAIGTDLSEGKTESFNQSLHSALRENAKQTTILAAQIMQRFGESLMSQVEEMISARFGGQEDNNFLKEAFPAYSDPAIAPTIEGVYKQSLIHTKGNKQKAIEMARGMLRYMGTQGGDAFGGRDAPTGRDDLVMGNNAKSLVDDLLGRS